MSMADPTPVDNLKTAAISKISAFHSDALKPAGAIHLIVGPMFAGKTTELLRRMREYQAAGLSCVFVKHAKDVRYCNEQTSDLAFSHDGASTKAIVCTELGEISSLLSTIDIILVDEGHFFSGLAIDANNLASSGKVITIAGLVQGIKFEPLRNMVSMIPLADNITMLKAKCVGCGTAASFTRKLDESDLTDMVGGSEKYEPLCRGCYLSRASQCDNPNTPVLKVKLLSSDAYLPTRATPFSAGLDVYTPRSVVITPGSTEPVSLDIAIELPPQTYGQIAARSGLALRCGLIVLAGVIDSDYRSNVVVLIHNLGSASQSLPRGVRIAQLVCHNITLPTPVFANTLSTAITHAGFGSTGD